MNKKILLNFILIVGFSLLSKAQEKGDIELGGQFGLNISNILDSGSDQFANSKISFNIGAFADFYINDRWSIKPKVIYDRKGWCDSFVIDDNFNLYSTDFKVNYITVPITVNYHFGKTRRWYFNFGGYVGFLGAAEDSEFGIDAKELFENTDFGLSYGIGYKHPLSDNLKLFIEYEGQSGVIDIFKGNPGDAILNGRSAFNAGLVFTVN